MIPHPCRLAAESHGFKYLFSLPSRRRAACLQREGHERDGAEPLTMAKDQQSLSAQSLSTLGIGGRGLFCYCTAAGVEDSKAGRK